MCLKMLRKKTKLMDCDQNIISLGNNKWLFETNPVLLSDPVTPFRATFQGIYHQVWPLK